MAMKENDVVYLPMFEGSLINGKMRSLADKTPAVYTTGAQEVAACEANGKGWQLDDWSNTQMVKDLLILLSKSTNVQAKYGRGNCSTSSVMSTGTTKSKGEFCGSNASNKAVKFLWIENWYADRFDRRYGCVTDSSRNIKVKMYPPYNTDGTGYDIVKNYSNNFDGYVKTTTINEYGEFPEAGGGSESTGLCSFARVYPGLFCLWGGSYGVGGGCGFYLNLYIAFSYSSSDIGGSPSFKKPR